MKSGSPSIRFILIILFLFWFINSGTLLFGANSPQSTSSKTTTNNQVISDTTALAPKNTSSNSQTVTIQKKPAHKHQKARNYYTLQIFGKDNVDRFKLSLIEYGNKHFPLFSRKYYFRIIEKSYQYPIIFLFINLILIFILNIVVVIYILYYTNRKKNYRERYVALYTEMYENVLRSYLFGDIDWELTRIKLKRIKRPLNRSILTDVLFNFQENLKGDMDTRIPDIFVKLKLHHDAWESAKSPLFYYKVKGIRELTNLYPQRAKAVVRFYLNFKNDVVRDEAQKSYLKLHPQRPFDFFKELTSPFTRWTQLSAFHLIRLHQIAVPQFVNFIHIKHVNVQNFCLRMITNFQQLENVSEIFRLIESPNEMTRNLCIRTTNDLRLFDGCEIIKGRFQMETRKNRIEIIRALRNIGTDNDFDFLESILLEGSVSEKIEVCRTLFYMNIESRNRLYQLSQSPDLDLERYIVHVSDSRN